MALPIRPTPILEGEEVIDFWRKVEQGLKEPSTYVPTPNLWKVVELIKKKRIA